jgi:hypothetical protein
VVFSIGALWCSAGSMSRTGVTFTTSCFPLFSVDGGRQVPGKATGKRKSCSSPSEHNNRDTARQQNAAGCQKVKSKKGESKAQRKRRKKLRSGAAVKAIS